MHPLPALLTVLTTCVLWGCASKVDQKGFLSSYGGLRAEKGVSNALVYEGNNDQLRYVDSVIVEEVQLLLSEERRGLKPVPEAEAEALAKKFEAALRMEFESHYELTDVPGESTVRIRTALVQLKPHSPELYVLSYAPYSFVVRGGIWAATGNNVVSGIAKFQGEMVDSRTGEQLYAIVDKDTGKKFQVGAGLRKWGHSEAAFKRWAKKMRVYLDEAKAEAKKAFASRQKAIGAETGEGVASEKRRMSDRMSSRAGSKRHKNEAGA